MAKERNEAREWWRKRAGVIRTARKACAKGRASPDAIPVPETEEDPPEMPRAFAAKALKVRCADLRRFHVNLGRPSETWRMRLDARRLKAYATEAAFWINALRENRHARLRAYFMRIGNPAALTAMGIAH